MSIEKTIELMEEIKQKEVDIKETIGVAVQAEYLSSDIYSVCPIYENNQFGKDFEDMSEKDYSNFEDFDDDLYGLIFDYLEKEGIYISLAYVGDFKEHGAVIFSGSEERLIFTDDEEFVVDDLQDFGIKIKKEGYNWDVSFGTRTQGPTCFTPPSFDPFVVSDDVDGFDSISNPLNQNIVEIMANQIVFKKD